MIFTKLTLNNFKSYGHEVIKFGDGITVIVGENGAGKSTILEAISFALFKQHTAKKIDDLVRNGSDENMYVDLEFVSNGKEYKIHREKTKSGLKSTLLKKTTSKGQFIPSCAGDKEVANEIQSILDIDSDLFLNAIYIRQGEIAELVDKTSSEKKQLIGKLLGLDSLEKAWKNLQPIISNYEKTQSELKGKLFSSEELKEEYDHKKALLGSLKEKGLDLEKQIEEVKEMKAEKQNEKTNMEREKEIFDNFNNNLDAEKKRLESLENDKRTLQDNLDEIKKAEEQIARLEKFVKKLPLYLDFEKSVTSIQQLELDKQKIEKDLDSIATQEELLATKKEGYNKFLAADEQIEKLNNQKINLEKELATLTQLEKDKKQLLKSIEGNRNEIERFFSVTKDNLYDNGLSQDILTDVDNFTQLEEVTDNFSEEVSNKVKDLSLEIISKNEEIVKFKQAIETAQKPLDELGDVENKCPVCQSDINPQKKNELIDSYNNEIKINEKSIEENKENIRLLNKNKDSFEEKYNRLQELSKDIIGYKNKFDNLEKDLVRLNEIDDGLESKEYTNTKLGELILDISKEKVGREENKEDYDAYIKSKGALDVLSSKTELQYKLNQVNNEVDVHVKNIKLAIDQDPHLSGDMSTADLQARITDLKNKEEEFNQLKGFVQNKKALESQLISKKDDIGVSLNQIEILKNKIEASVYDKEKYEKVIYFYEVYERRYDEFAGELSEIKGQAKELIANVNVLAEKILTNYKFQQEYKNTTDYIDLLNHIRTLYSKNGIQKELRNRSRPVIQKYTKDFFDEFNFNYSDLTLDEDYEVTVFGPEGEASMSMVSGGEKIAIAIALRLGITQAMAKGDLDTILLDEPTIHLDSFRRHELINLLKDMTVLPQMIIVTHESQLENAADNLVKVEKNNGISKVSN